MRSQSRSSNPPPNPPRVLLLPALKDRSRNPNVLTFCLPTTPPRPPYSPTPSRKTPPTPARLGLEGRLEEGPPSPVRGPGGVLRDGDGFGGVGKVSPMLGEPRPDPGGLPSDARRVAAAAQRDVEKLEGGNRRPARPRRRV